MSKLLRLCLIFMFLSTVVRSEDAFVELASEVQFPLPPSWSAPEDATNYPFRIVHARSDAELLIFRSEIEPEEAIASDDDLQESVRRVVNDVILSLPESKLLTNSGYYERERCGFILDFVSLDSSSGVQLRHRLNGVIYRLSEGGQILFTLWGKAPGSQYSDIENELILMQTGFSFNGPRTTDVYGSASNSDWILYIMMAIAVSSLLTIRNMRRRDNSQGKIAADQLWHCHCGHQNREHANTCHRCQMPRPVVPIR